MIIILKKMNDQQREEEPRQNDIIEKFNGTYLKRVLGAYTFKDFEKLCLQEQLFNDFQNHITATVHKNTKHLMKRMP